MATFSERRLKDKWDDHTAKNELASSVQHHAAIATAGVLGVNDPLVSFDAFAAEHEAAFNRENAQQQAIDDFDELRRSPGEPLSVHHLHLLKHFLKAFDEFATAAETNRILIRQFLETMPEEEHRILLEMRTDSYSMALEHALFAEAVIVEHHRTRDERGPGKSNPWSHLTQPCNSCREAFTPLGKGSLTLIQRGFNCYQAGHLEWQKAYKERHLPMVSGLGGSQSLTETSAEASGTEAMPTHRCREPAEN